MIRTITLLYVLLSCACFAESRIQDRELSRTEVHRVSCAPSVVTTVVLPGPITSLDGAGFIADPGLEQGKFLLAFRPGDSFFTVEPLVAKATANLNVMVKGEVYVLLLEDNPADFAYVVRFETVAGAGKPIGKQDKVATDRQLLSLMEVLKGFPLLERFNRDALTGIESTEGTIDWEKLRSGVQYRMVRTIRRDSIDAVAYLFEIRSDRKIVVDYPSVGVSSGNRVYSATIADINAVVEPGETGTVAIVIQGDGRGGRNNLSAGSEVTLQLGELVEAQ